MITNIIHQVMDRVHSTKLGSQIVWQPHMQSIILPKVLQWLASQIRDYNRQLTQLASDWMTELDCCEAGEPAGQSVSKYHQSYANKRIQICAHTMAYKQGFQEYKGDHFNCNCSQDSEYPQDNWRMDCLGTLMRPVCLPCP